MRSSRTRIRLGTLALALCVAAAPGCAYLRVPRIDPTGQRVFAEPPLAGAPQYQSQPGGHLPWDDVALTLSPKTTVAPVGSEVVLLAGILGGDNYLRTNRRLEWSLAPGGVGHFVAVGKTGAVDMLLGDFNRPRKIDNTFAVGSTSRNYLRLDRGTPTLEDDVCVLRGQGWITLTSPVEGASQVMVYGPSVHGWSNRTQTATVHWVDAQWRFPPPAINPAGGRHVLTTTVIRHSNGTPCAGWRVRYEVADGPAAGFAPDGAAAIDVVTDGAGQAGAEIFQQSPARGTNRVCVRVIRPASLGDSNGRELVVGTGSTLVTWSAPDLAVRKTGPAVASPGATISYAVEVSNPGDLRAEQVVVTDTLPDTLTYLDSNPAAEVSGQTLRWPLGELAAGESRRLTLDCRADQPGTVSNSAEATADGGGAVGQLKASDTATTNVGAPTIEVEVFSPARATVGTEVTFRMIVHNRGQVAATGLLIKDRFDPGLQHPAMPGPQRRVIERELGELAPGASREITVTFRAMQAGRLCHTVEVSSAGSVLASAEGCVTAVAAAAVETPTEEPSPQPRPMISVTKTGPQQAAVGALAQFTIDVTNSGTQPLTGVKVVDQYDAALNPEMATDGYAIENNDLVWTINTLAPGKTERLQVHCRCRKAAAKACNRVVATAGETARDEAEACLQIEAVKSALKITAAALREPVAVGRNVTYEILVTNGGTVAETQVAVVATVPLGMTPAALGTTGPAQAPKPTIQGQTVQFDPVAEIPPGKTLVYRVVVRAGQRGDFVFHAELISPSRTLPLAADAKTQVF
ncbi:MAG: DUF11 domain-containing protein [Pirellulales bacterium]|nr:DUF11 domain-containing protein [Pirellulales bacterium]